jgi:hypothetical protein
VNRTLAVVRLILGLVQMAGAVGFAPVVFADRFCANSYLGVVCYNRFFPR